MHLQAPRNVTHPGLPVFASKRAPPVRAAVRTVLRAVFAPCGASEVDDGVWRVFGETGGDGGETTVLPTSWPPGKFGSPVFFRGNGNGSESSDPGIPTRVLVSKSNVPSPDLQNFKMTVIHRKPACWSFAVKNNVLCICVFFAAFKSFKCSFLQDLLIYMFRSMLFR